MSCQDTFPLLSALMAYLNHKPISLEWTLLPKPGAADTWFPVCRKLIKCCLEFSQLASMRSISCNIQHLAQQQGQHTIQWSMLGKRTFHDFRQADMANQWWNPHEDVIKWIKVRVDWRQQGSEHGEHCTAYDLKSSIRRSKDGKRNLSATKNNRNGSRMIWIDRPQWRESEIKTQRQRLCKSRIWCGMLKWHDPQPQSRKHYLRRCWMLSVTVWAILHVLKRGGWERQGWWWGRYRAWQAERRWWTWLGDGHYLQNGTAPHGELLAEADEAWRTDATGMGGRCWFLLWERYDLPDDWTEGSGSCETQNRHDSSHTITDNIGRADADPWYRPCTIPNAASDISTGK